MTAFTDENNTVYCVRKIMFFSVKVVIVLLILISGIFIAAQSSIAPVSMRLLTEYGMEYATNTFKPFRPYFPEPFLIKLHQK